LKIAYYAPLKSPLHCRPSGDRLVARLFQKSIEDGGFDVELASEFRSWEGEGDPERQQQIRETGTELAHRLVSEYSIPDSQPALWFTYHVYHKAPDWIGPVVCSSLKIPYVVAEASFAPKQSNGPWHIGHEQCRAGIHAADAVISLNRQDDPCLRGVLKPSCELVELKPFISLDGIDTISADRAKVAQRWGAAADPPWLVCVAMMREGDKLASYRELARALTLAEQDSWHLLMIGDGPARQRISNLFKPFASRTTETGLLSRQEIYTILRSSDLYVWPAVNEAYGMALLEAQACGLPVVASAVGGIPQIVEHGTTGLLAPSNDTQTLSRYIRELIHSPALGKKMGARAQEKCMREHNIHHATTVQAELFSRLIDKT